ncbi:MAG: hypothetical protein OEV43_00860 [Coriobacteriia bacterium]|nr:hypothetical protein [Coriobacteriia bacterium]
MTPPILVVMLDGLADRPWPALGGLTPLAAASTPNLDAFAKHSATGILNPLGPGRAPATELAHFVLFGYPEPEYPGRGVFEAAGAGVAVSDDDVVLHALLVRVRRESDGTLTIIERYPGPSEIDPSEMVAEIECFEAEGLSLRLVHMEGPEAALIVSGGASTDVTDTDPHNNGWQAGSVQPLDTAEDLQVAERTSRALTAYLRHAYAELKELVGATDPESPFLLLKWTSRPPRLASFREHVGMRGTVVSSARILAGLSTVLGMEHLALPALSDPAEDMHTRLSAGVGALESGAEFVLVHNKGPDEAGHAKDPVAKRDLIAGIDAGLEGLADRTGLPPECIVVVTGDHGTPSGTALIHSGDPVALAVMSDAVGADDVDAFDERACARGSLGHLRGEDFMPLLLNARGTVRYTGGKLSPHVGLFWPKDYEPFRVD